MTNINEKEVLLCMQWLRTQKLIKTLISSSYSLKHVVERLHNTYISNESFIEAVKLLGIPYKEHGSNIKIGIK